MCLSKLFKDYHIYLQSEAELNEKEFINTTTPPVVTPPVVTNTTTPPVANNSTIPVGANTVNTTAQLTAALNSARLVVPYM